MTPLLLPSRSIALTLLALVVMLAGSGASAQTFTGANNGDWNNAGNWSAFPINGGAPNLAIVFGAVPQGSRTTNQNRGTPFNLNTLTFQGDQITIDGQPLQFNNNGASVVISANDAGQVIASGVILNANLELRGGAQSTNSYAGILISGAISEAGGARTITVNVHQTAFAALVGSNAYSGVTHLASGTLLVGDAAALGTGALNITGSNTALAAFIADTTINNTINISNNTAFAASIPFTSALTLSGAVNFTAPAANTTRQVALRSGPVPETVISGAMTTDANTVTLRLTGENAPVVNEAKKTFANADTPNYGSILIISGNSPNFRAGIQVVSATLRLNGNLGSAATPINGNVQIGNGTAAAAFIGRGKIFLDKTTFFQPGGRPGGRVDVAKKAITRAGNSPGQLTINGGGVTFHGGSIMGVDIGGPPLLTSNVGASQLVLEDGDLDLLFEGGEHPYLGVAVLASQYIPQIGDCWCIVDIQNSLVPRVDLPNPLNIYNSGPNVFAAPDGTVLNNMGTFVADGFTFQIRYNADAGDPSNPLLEGNDITLTVVAIPAPGAAGVLVTALLFASRRRRI